MSAPESPLPERPAAESPARGPSAPAPSATSPAPPAPDERTWARPAATASQRRADLALAAALFVGAVLAQMLYRYAGVFSDPAPVGASLIWAVAITAPLTLRRRYPASVSLVVSTVFILGGQFAVPEYLFSNIALFIALYTVGAWTNDRRRAFIVRSVIVVAMMVWLTVSIFVQATDPDFLHDFGGLGGMTPYVSYMLINVLTNLLYFGGAWYFGDHSYASARQRARIEAQAEALEEASAREARQAVALERVRIARELHDVVAHHVSVMGVQAGAARTVMDIDADAAREALRSVESNARTAIDELHNLVTTLRDPAEGSLAPVPSDEVSTLTVDAIADLARASTEAGVPTRFERVGAPRPVVGVIAVSLYRIAQEALTNVRKYAGPDARADVRLRFRDAELELEVSNTGNVPATPRRGGLGHVGMRERVAAVGGTVEIGPRTDAEGASGYLVRAHVPLPDAAAPASDADTDRKATAP